MYGCDVGNYSPVIKDQILTILDLSFAQCVDVPLIPTRLENISILPVFPPSGEKMPVHGRVISAPIQATFTIRSFLDTSSSQKSSCSELISHSQWMLPSNNRLVEPSGILSEY